MSTTLVTGGNIVDKTPASPTQPIVVDDISQSATVTALVTLALLPITLYTIYLVNNVKVHVTANSYSTSRLPFSFTDSNLYLFTAFAWLPTGVAIFVLLNPGGAKRIFATIFSAVFGAFFTACFIFLATGIAAFISLSGDGTPTAFLSAHNLQNITWPEQPGRFYALDNDGNRVALNYETGANGAYILTILGINNQSAASK